MQTHKMQIVIPEDHRLVVEVPESIRSGPAELIFVVSEGQIESSRKDRTRTLWRGGMPRWLRWPRIHARSVP